jgi:hypothetical protein
MTRISRCAIPLAFLLAASASAALASEASGQRGYSIDACA